MLERVGKGIARAAEALCVAAFVGVFLVFLWKILMRYAAGSALAWADEVTVVLFVWIVFIANGFVVEERRQIRFDLICRHVGARTQRVLAVLRILVVGGIFGAALPGSLDYIAFLWRERTPVLLWRLDILYACFGLFMIAILVRLAVQLIRLAGPRWRDGL